MRNPIAALLARLFGLLKGGSTGHPVAAHAIDRPVSGRGKAACAAGASSRQGRSARSGPAWGWGPRPGFPYGQGAGAAW